ncbi:hypothetical protein KP509_38G069600 [Ceratopteris richardii]|uniref:Uncharacterized protein n=1 Tax=Ceratopteris richardii TaxID=49495 RepID=A0A8T2Q5S3_CERRI|nr:hypothetical protein KP509_38G069600 [Ceratopteris richardii]
MNIEAHAMNIEPRAACLTPEAIVLIAHDSSHKSLLQATAIVHRV